MNVIFSALFLIAGIYSITNLKKLIIKQKVSLFLQIHSLHLKNILLRKNAKHWYVFPFHLAEDASTKFIS